MYVGYIDHRKEKTFQFFWEPSFSVAASMQNSALNKIVFSTNGWLVYPLQNLLPMEEMELPPKSAFQMTWRALDESKQDL